MAVVAAMTQVLICVEGCECIVAVVALVVVAVPVSSHHSFVFSDARARGCMGQSVGWRQQAAGSAASCCCGQRVVRSRCRMMLHGFRQSPLFG